MIRGEHNKQKENVLFQNSIGVIFAAADGAVVAAIDADVIAVLDESNFGNVVLGLPFVELGQVALTKFRQVCLMRRTDADLALS